MNIIGDVKDKTCILLDDIADSAGTLCNAAKALKDSGAKEIYSYLMSNNVDVFYDDRDASPGNKFSDSNLMGNPYQIVISEKNVEKGLIEIINRRDQAKSEITEKDLLGLFD